MVENIVLFPGITDFILEGDGDVLVVGIYFSAAFVGNGKHRFEA